MDTHSRAIETQTRWTAIAVLLLLFMPTLYVLSFGPAVYVSMYGEISDQAQEALIWFYWPVICAKEKSPFFARTMRRYEELWCGPLPDLSKRAAAS
jgi:hypothetical protein